MDMKTYISASYRVYRLTNDDMITTSVKTDGLDGYGGYGGTSSGHIADAPGRRSIWD